MAKFTTLTLEGKYTYKGFRGFLMGLFDKGYMKFDLVYDSYAQTIDGFGCDYIGLFTAVGTYDGVNIDFVKDYGTHSWIYTGRKKASSKKNELSGVWGTQQQLERAKAGGSFVLRVIAEN